MTTPLGLHGGSEYCSLAYGPRKVLRWFGWLQLLASDHAASWSHFGSRRVLVTVRGAGILALALRPIALLLPHSAGAGSASARTPSSLYSGTRTFLVNGSRSRPPARL